jgi:hypothetical protein
MKLKIKQSKYEPIRRGFAWIPMKFRDYETGETVFIWLEQYWYVEVGAAADVAIFRTLEGPEYLNDLI